MEGLGYCMAFLVKLYIMKLHIRASSALRGFVSTPDVCGPSTPKGPRYCYGEYFPKSSY